MQKSTKAKRYLSAALISIIIVTLQSSIIMLISAAAFINANTSAYMWFGVDIDDENWNAKSQYSWESRANIRSDIVNKAWSESFLEVPLNYYSADNLIIAFANALHRDINASADSSEQYDNTIYAVIESNEIKSYVGDFLRQQAGCLIGDNRMPTPNRNELKNIISASFESHGNEQTQMWYDENENALIESFYAGLIATNDRFSETLLTDNEPLAEAVLTFKVLNLSICVYFMIVAIIICSVVMKFVLTSIPDFCVFMFFNQIASILMSIGYIFCVGDISLVVLGNIFTPGATMVADTKQLMWLLVSIYGIAATIFGVYAIERRWGFKNVIHKTRITLKRLFSKKSEQKHDTLL